MASLLRKVAPPIGGGRDRDQSRSTPSATVAKQSKSRDGQATMTVTVPQDLKKGRVQSNEGASRAKSPRQGGKSRGDKKQTE